MTTYTTPFPQIPTTPSPITTASSSMSLNMSSCCNCDFRVENGYLIRPMPSMLSAKGFTAMNMKAKRDIIDGLVKPKKTRRASVPSDMRSMPSFKINKSLDTASGKLLPAIPEDVDEPIQRPRFFSVGSNTASSSSLANLALSQTSTTSVSPLTTSPSFVAPVEQESSSLVQLM